MQDDQWHDVAALGDIPASAPHGVDIGETHLVLVRDGETVHAMQGNCPHAGAKLEQGSYANGHIVCPWHMASFRVDDGALLQPPALSGLCSYPVRVQDGRVAVQMHARERAKPAATCTVADVVIVGGGAASAAAISGLRDGGYAGNITVIEPRADEPLDRTVLSKMTLAGKKPLDSIALFDAARMQALDVRRLATTVTALDVDAHELTTADGGRIRFERCILATGAEPVRPSFHGSDSDRLFTLRDSGDVAPILELIPRSKHAVVLGTSFIALEAASALRSAGLEVSVVGKSALPFEKLFGKEVATALFELHKANGIRFLHENVRGVSTAAETVSIAFEAGASLDCDFVIAGYGVKPRTSMFAGLETQEDGGIVVDETLQASPGIYALGDIAAVRRQGRPPLRIEHWRLAEQHGLHAARGILGASAAFDATPFFWTQQHGKRLAYIGHATSFDSVVIDGNLNEMKFVAWYIEHDKVVAALTCGKERETTVLTDRLRATHTLSEARALIVS